MKDMENFSFLESKDPYLFLGSIKNSKLEEFFVFDQENKSKVGNIYRARLINKIKGLNGFFVDLGDEKHGLLQVDEKRFKELKEADELILQVTYDGNDHKGPKLTEKYELKGEYFILTPFDKKIRLSKKFRDKAYGLELKEKFKEKSQGLGFIIRTESQEASLEVLEEEFQKLLDLYESLEKERNFSPTPKLLYQPDYLKEYMSLTDSGLFLTNDKFFLEKIKKAYPNGEVLLDKDFSIRNNPLIFKEIKDLFNRKVTLENGIELVFDKTEAFHVIDINSKGFLNPGKDQAKDVNLNCYEEIIKQIHLRNIYGIILIDFISYSNKKDEEKLLNYFYQESRKYKNPVNVIGFTRLGILELTRNKAVTNLSLEDLGPSIF